MLKLKGKKVAVIGLSKRTGVAVAKTLAKYGAKVVVSDIKSAAELVEELNLLQGLELEYELGGHGPKSLAADLIVVSPGVPLDIPFFRQARLKKIPIISEIELAYQLTRANIIAITGTNGKTTTTSLLGEILKKSKLSKVKVAGNIGTPLISEIQQVGSGDWLVVEVSSFQLETIQDFRPALSIYLNFTPDHLDRHKSIANYWLAKKRIFENQTTDDIAILNADDPEVMRAASDLPAQKYLVSTKGEVKKGIFLQEGSLYLQTGEGKQEIISLQDIPLKGEHNVQNVAFASLAAYLLGVDRKLIRKVVAAFRPVSHRLEELPFALAGSRVFDDSKATNPDAAIKGMEAFQEPIVLIAGGQDRNADFSELARVIKKKVKALILLGETREKIKKAVQKEGFPEQKIFLVTNMAEAVQKAVPELKPGDCLLLSPGCPSWDMYSSYRERGEDFRQNVERLRG